MRNSIILVDFIELRLKEGMALDEAVIDAGAVRFRPMMLTAAAVVVGAGDHSVRPDISGTGHRADGRRSRFAGALAHDRADRLFRCESKEESAMTIERYLRLIAGFFVMLSVALGYWVHPALVSVHGLCGAESVSIGIHQLVPDDDVSAQAGRSALSERIVPGTAHSRRRKRV